MKHQVRTPLEPISVTLMAVVLAHLLAGIVAWQWLRSAPKQPAGSARLDLHWMSPADFRQVPIPPPPPAALKPAPAASLPAAKPAVKPAAKPATPETAPVPQQPTQALWKPKSTTKEPNKFITLSPVLPEVDGPPAPPKPYKPVLSLLDVAALNEAKSEAPDARSPEMDAVDDAVVDAYLNAWVAPAIANVPPHQRRARLQVAIRRDGTVVAARMGSASGSVALDGSVLEAAQQVTKIPATLPSSFRKESYDLQINFQIE